MYVLPYAQAERALLGAREALPNEASGVLLGRRRRREIELHLVLTSSAENTPASFIIRTATYREVQSSFAGSGLTVCGCFHAHPRGPSRPSERDRQAKKNIGDLWLIYSLNWRELKLFEWDGQDFERQRYRIAV
jgi:proteasome lid subunit RPN8/RPN11